ncbi:hypothetical protein ACIRL0_11155 [Streptomyces sp. NPDC102365]|uniref:hypothetical protein n=1 Tax=Streptomyces sp. NPDC102365 TaxID=3366162 RepID=UPI003826C791
MARPRRSAGIAVLVLASLVLALTAAWALNDRSAAPAADTGTAAQPAARQAVLTALRNGLPLSALLRRTTETSRRVHEAEQLLVAACMSARGFRYTPAPAAPEASGRSEASGTSGTSGTSPALFGFESLGAAGDALTPESQPAERPRGKGFDRALYGDPKHKISARNKVLRVSRPATGCLAESQTRLLGEDGRVRDLALRMRLDQGERDALAELEKDPAFRTVTSRWKTCMARAGVTAKDPRRLAADLPATADPATDPTARADVTCKERTGYLTQAYARLAVTQRRWLDDNKEPASEWRTLRHREDTAARRVLEASGDR